MAFTIPGMPIKTISFKRMNSKHVKSYKIYGIFKDSNYTSGLRTELLEEIKNPSVPNTELTTVKLDYNDNYTWELPNDLFTDREHKFKLFINKAIVSAMYYQYNKYSKLLTIDKNLKPLTVNDTIELEYYRDRIKRTFVVSQDCQIKIEPVFADTYTYGNHNVII